MSFPRSELDVACDDPRCPPDSVVTLYFATDAKRQDGPVPAPTPAVPHASAHHDPILHWDSYTNLEISDDGESTRSASFHCVVPQGIERNFENSKKADDERSHGVIDEGVRVERSTRLS